MPKALATALNKSKKKKGFFFLDLKRPHITRVTSGRIALRSCDQYNVNYARSF
jgi:hypothetical protein